MQKAKRLLFIASIFELVLAGLFLIVDIIYSSEWLASINGNQTVNIIITVSLFVIAMMLTVDGILTLRYSKADDEVAKKCQRARLFAGIVFIVLTIASFVVNWFLEQSNIMELVSDVTVISFLLFIVMAVLNLCCSSAMNKKSEPIAKVEQVKPVQKIVKKEDKLDVLIEKLTSLSILREKELITQEEFENLRKQIVDSYKN